MPAAYRPPRPGDLLAVRTSHATDDEQQVVVHTVWDDGAVILLAGTWQDRDLEVLIRRVGDPDPSPDGAPHARAR